MKLIPALLISLAFAPVVSAQQSGGAPRDAGVTKDPATAPAGSYQLDPKHTSIIARIGHGGGTSFSTFRFGMAEGTLSWNPVDPAANALKVTVDMTSLGTPVPGFAAELIGERFLKTAQFHDATFISKSVQKTGPTTGRVSGELLFMGQTRPATVDVTFVGAGMSRSVPVIGFSGTLRFKRSDFGFTTLMGPIADEVEMLLDVEFDKAG